MEAVEVTAHFNILGEVTPIQLTWRGQVYPLQAGGRHWKDETGLHMLAMIPGDQVIELVFLAETCTWQLHRLQQTAFI